MKTSANQKIGKRYGRLVVQSIHDPSIGSGRIEFVCLCDCGSTAVKTGWSLMRNKVSGCSDCFSERMSVNATKHGGAKDGKTRLFNIWQGMRKRCRNKNVKSAVDYILRGISVCQEWEDFSIFRDWANSNGYTDELTIERDDVNGNYEPSNCMWIPKSEQQRNTRSTRRINFMGNIFASAEIERKMNFKRNEIHYFYKRYNITHQEAFNRLYSRKILQLFSGNSMAA